MTFVCHFGTQLAGFVPGDTMGMLRGRLETGRRPAGRIPSTLYQTGTDSVPVAASGDLVQQRDELNTPA